MLYNKIKIEEDVCYHLYNRGNNRERIFFEPDNYIFFINRFKRYVAPFCEIYAFCLMPNHFHFFVKIRNKEYFEKGIKNFFISYSKSINKKYDRVGSLCQGRYKATEIGSESYYTRIITYIHQNPVKAGLVSRMEDYTYSSYRNYLSDDSTFLAKTEVIAWFHNLNHFINEHKL